MNAALGRVMNRREQDGGVVQVFAQTLATQGGDASLDQTMAPSDAQGSGPVVVRAGGTGDYGSLVAVDPKHYVVGKEIARGGMGRISVARDRRLGRSVALKELLVESPELRARFEREARITAKLQHPSIVNLLEAGAWPNGEPFYVMKLVSGESLDKVIAARPTLAARMSLLPNVIAVADALAYAHAARVIHRDLKPGNVLVGAYGETVVIDWGLAKDLADASGVDDVPVGPMRAPAVGGDSTQLGAVLGTPAYMPIEQAEGRPVDARADVYALGAMLYHVLAGTPPYVGRSADSVLDAVIDGPPLPIEERVRDAPRDLVAIVNKAMARSAEDRYPSAHELVEDLKRFQTGQLVGAHQYTSWQLVGRWLRRHRTAVAVGTIAVVALAVTGVVSMRRIFAEQARTDAQRVLAVQKGRDAEELLGFMLGDLQKKLEPLGKVELLGDAAKKAMAYYGRKGEQLTATERGVRSLAHRNLGDVLFAQGHTDLAITQYRTAIAHAQAAVGTRPDKRNALVYEVVQSHVALGEVLVRTDVLAAVDEYERALAIADSQPATEDLTNGWATASADIHARIGQALGQRDAKRALAEFQSAAATYERLAARHPDNARLRESLSTTHASLSWIYERQGDTVSALQSVRRALAINDARGAGAPTDPDVQRTRMFDRQRLASLQRVTGDRKGALATSRESLEIGARLAAQDPHNMKLQEDLSICHGTLAELLNEQGDVSGARAELQASLAIDQRLLDLEPTDEAKQQAVSFTRTQIGNLTLLEGDLVGARANFDAALATAQRLAKSQPHDLNRQLNVAVSTVNVGNVMLARKDSAGALKRYRSATAVFEQGVTLDPTNVDLQSYLAEARQLIGDALVAQKKWALAVVEYNAVKALREQMTERAPANVGWRGDLADTYRKLGDAHRAQHDRKQALVAYTTGLRIAREVASRMSDQPGVAERVATLAKKVRTHDRTRSGRRSSNTR